MNVSSSTLQAHTPTTLENENRRYKGSGGISQENYHCGFLPAFLDTSTGSIHLSRFADGRMALIHLLDGLPEQLVLQRGAFDRVIAVKSSVTAGFFRDGRFYTREQAAQAMPTEQGIGVAMYESDDSNIDTLLMEGDVCGDYDIPESPDQWSLEDFEDILPAVYD
jgi:hypothetical protein